MQDLRRGRFWHAHEAWEEDWQTTRDPVVRGMIQLAAALFHLRGGNLAGAQRLYERALGKLAEADPVHRGLPTRPQPLSSYQDLSLRSSARLLS